MSITVMDTIDQITYALLTGAAASGMITYYILTHEKRIIASVRRMISFLGDCHELTEREWRELGSNTIASDERIIAIYRWAKETRSRLKQESRIKISDISLTAEVIICEEFYGLDRFAALRLLIQSRGQSGTLDDLRALTGALIGKKSKGTIAEENWRAYKENYQREGRTLKNRILADLEAISTGERCSFTSEGINAAKGLQARHGDHPNTVAEWAPVLKAITSELVDAEAVHDQIDDILYPDTLEDIEALQKILDEQFRKHTSHEIEHTSPAGKKASRALARLKERKERKIQEEIEAAIADWARKEAPRKEFWGLPPKVVTDLEASLKATLKKQVNAERFDREDPLHRELHRDGEAERERDRKFRAATVPMWARIEEDRRRRLSVVKSGVVDGMTYTLYSDGSIEVQRPKGIVCFDSIDKLQDHVEKVRD